MFVNEWVLVREDTGAPVVPGDMVCSFRGESRVLGGGHPPRHSASTGRVWVEGQVTEYFPGVFGLQWRACS